MLIWNLAASYESLGDRLGHKFTAIGLHERGGKDKNEEKRGERDKSARNNSGNIHWPTSRLTDLTIVSLFSVESYR